MSIALHQRPFFAEGVLDLDLAVAEGEHIDHAHLQALAVGSARAASAR
jgi:hypothetical protein